MAATTRDTFSPDNNGVTKIPIVSSTPFSSSFKEIPPPFDVPHLLEDITSNAKVGSQGDEKARKKALAAARSLCLALETPPEAIVRIAWAEPALSVAARVAIALNVFEHLSKDAGKSSSELAALTGADPVLLGRILKHLAAMGVIHEVDADSYASTSLARALTVPIYRDGIPF
ncbi:hypothetical protein MMC08_009033, partial [Hypocenomyce scalaris]|nr:hypothetical protein [Hypocenomyce scalaris]